MITFGWSLPSHCLSSSGKKETNLPSPMMSGGKTQMALLFFLIFNGRWFYYLLKPWWLTASVYFEGNYSHQWWSPQPAKVAFRLNRMFNEQACKGQRGSSNTLWLWLVSLVYSKTKERERERKWARERADERDSFNIDWPMAVYLPLRARFNP